MAGITHSVRWFSHGESSIQFGDFPGSHVCFGFDSIRKAIDFFPMLRMFSFFFTSHKVGSHGCSSAQQKFYSWFDPALWTAWRFKLCFHQEICRGPLGKKVDMFTFGECCQQTLARCEIHIASDRADHRMIFPVTQIRELSIWNTDEACKILPSLKQVLVLGCLYRSLSAMCGHGSKLKRYDLVSGFEHFFPHIGNSPAH